MNDSIAGPKPPRGKKRSAAGPGLFCFSVPHPASDAVANWLEGKGMQHVRGAPSHQQTERKIERWHQTLKNRILLENYYLPGYLERQIGTFVEYYNHFRYHESIENLRPAEIYFGKAETILAERRRIKLDTIANRRLQHRLREA